MGFFTGANVRPDMSVSGLCQICENRTAQHDCTRCGKLVCEVHFDTETRLCAQCASETDPQQTDQDTYQY